jgi:hypothetical protein
MDLFRHLAPLSFLPMAPTHHAELIQGPHLAENTFQLPRLIENTVQLLYLTGNTIHIPRPIGNTVHIPHPTGNAVHLPHLTENTVHPPCLTENSVYPPGIAMVDLTDGTVIRHVDRTLMIETAHRRHIQVTTQKAVQAEVGVDASDQVIEDVVVALIHETVIALVVIDLWLSLPSFFLPEVDLDPHPRVITAPSQGPPSALDPHLLHQPPTILHPPHERDAGESVPVRHGTPSMLERGGETPGHRPHSAPSFVDRRVPTLLSERGDGAERPVRYPAESETKRRLPESQAERLVEAQPER